jgi:DNA repair protein RecO (recombination protein O)
MSEIVKTEAVVLKTIKYRETSKIVTYFTKEHGKLSGIIKGARSSKNMYGTALEPMSHVSLVVYEKKGRDIQTIAQCELVQSYRKLFEDLDKMVVGMAVIELVRDIAHEQEKNVPLFEFLVKTLSALNNATGNAVNLFYAFEIHLADILGFHPSFNKCLSCGKQVVPEGGGIKKVEFHLDKGAPICGQCHSAYAQKVAVSAEGMMILDFLSRQTDIGKAANIQIEKNVGLEIESVLFAFLRHHVSGVKALKSRRVFRNIVGTI